MSRLVIITRPDLLPGFELARVGGAYGAEDVDTAEEIIGGLLDSGESGLLAIDDSILAQIDAALKRRLDAAEQLPYISIPGGRPVGPESSRKAHLARMIRQAIGIHIIFTSDEKAGD
jgi:vacuolar-type H+-ATPase subunit F/Vma7